MATLLAKTYAIPTITAVRSTCLGTQYTVETPEFIDTVTVNGEHITCTCGKARCSHSSAVTRRRGLENQQATNRSAYCSTFEIYA